MLTFMGKALFLLWTIFLLEKSTVEAVRTLDVSKWNLPLCKQGEDYTIEVTSGGQEPRILCRKVDEEFRSNGKENLFIWYNQWMADNLFYPLTWLLNTVMAVCILKKGYLLLRRLLHHPRQVINFVNPLKKDVFSNLKRGNKIPYHFENNLEKAFNYDYKLHEEAPVAKSPSGGLCEESKYTNDDLQEILIMEELNSSHHPENSFTYERKQAEVYLEIPMAYNESYSRIQSWLEDIPAEESLQFSREICQNSVTISMDVDQEIDNSFNTFSEEMASQSCKSEN